MPEGYLVGQQNAYFSNRPYLVKIFTYLGYLHDQKYAKICLHSLRTVPNQTRTLIVFEEKPSQHGIFAHKNNIKIYSRHDFTIVCITVRCIRQ